MIEDFTPNRPDFTGGVKSKTHRRQWAFNAFNAFNGFSLGGYTWARAHTDATYPYENRVKCVKRVNSPTPSCDCGLTFGQVWRKIRRKIGVVAR